MSDLITFTGNLADAPKTGTTQSGAPMCRFKVLVNHPDRNGQKVPPTAYDVTAFDNKASSLASNCATSLHKGDRVTVQATFSPYTVKYQEPNQQTGQMEERYATVAAFTAQEIGVNLRWASAVVTRNPKNDQTQTAPQGGFGQAPAQGGFQQTAPQGGFGQAPAQGGFQQTAPQGGFGQAPAQVGFGQGSPAAAAGGFNASAPAVSSF